MYVVNQCNGSERDGRWESQLRKGSLDLAILAVLWKRQLYGLEILRNLQEAPGLELAEGTLYPILTRLKQEGMLNSKWVEAETGHPRKYYWLTPAGRKAARNMADTWNALSRSLSALLAPVEDQLKETS